MLRLVTYDITKDRLRQKVADHLLMIGFRRIQHSVYMGDVRERSLQKFLQKFQHRLADTDKLYILPLTERLISEAVRLGPLEDQELILNQLATFVA